MRPLFDLSYETLFHLRLLPALLICLLIGSAENAVAFQTTLTPRLNERVTWNDNFYLHDFSDFEILSEPELGTTFESERSKFDIQSKLSDYRYADYDGYNRTNYLVGSGWEYALSETFNFRLNGSWIQDHSVDTLLQELTGDGVPILKRDTYNMGANLSFQLSELDSLNLGFSYSQLDYAKRYRNFSDYNMFGANATWQHTLLDGRMALVTQANWQHVEFDSPGFDATLGYWLVFPVLGNIKQDTTQDVATLMAGVYILPTDTLTLRLMAGITNTWSKIETNQEIVSPFSQSSKSTNRSDAIGFTGEFDLTQRFQNGNYNLKISQEHTPSTYGELKKSTRVTISSYYSITERLASFLYASYTNNKSNDISDYNKIDTEYWFVGLTARYSFTEDLSLALNYSYMYHLDNSNNNNNEQSNAIQLRFTYALPKKF